MSDWSYYKIIGMQGTIFTRIDGVMILGMFAGCISAALWANNVKWRNQPHKRRIVQALIGGALAGFGARLAMGCNLASLSSPVFHNFRSTLGSSRLRQPCTLRR